MNDSNGSFLVKNYDIFKNFQNSSRVHLNNFKIKNWKKKSKIVNFKINKENANKT